jgi:hypothetical protein
MNSSGDFTRWCGAVAPGVLELRDHLTGGVGLYAFVGQRREGAFADSSNLRGAFAAQAAARRLGNTRTSSTVS